MITPELNKVYLVTHRTWDNKKLVTAKRQFLGTENRFGTILCYVFSSRITKRRYASELSIPHYDLKEVKEV
jgi:hypothetical protein